MTKTLHKRDVFILGAFCLVGACSVFSFLQLPPLSAAAHRVLGNQLKSAYLFHKAIVETSPIFILIALVYLGYLFQNHVMRPAIRVSCYTGLFVIYGCFMIFYSHYTQSYINPCEYRMC